MDESELRGGDVWDRQIREQIHDCRLFIPVISANTDARDEGYFRREWSLAVDRTRDMAEKKPFLLPVVIDETPERVAAVPDKFHHIQWTRLPGGMTSEAFVSRVGALLGVEARPPGRAELAPAGAPQRQPPARHLRWYPLVLGALAVLMAAGGWIGWRTTRSTPELGNSGAPSAAAADKSVAVLPFVDMSEKHDQEYFSDGLSEQLIDVLTQVPGLRVPARTSSFSFKGKAVTVGEIARVLGVTHLLEGSVRKAGDRLRVTAQLIRADDGFHEWSRTYDRDVHDVFGVQDDIARSVAEQLKVMLMTGAGDAAARNVSPEAYNLYLQARFRTARENDVDLTAAVDLYERAIAVAPRYAAPWAWLAYSQTRLIANGDTSEASYRRAREAAARAIELDPDLVEGYVAGGIAAMTYSRDWATSRNLLDQALAKGPNNALALQFQGHLTQAIGSITDAERYMRRAVDLDPLNPLPRRYLARLVLNEGRATDSAAILRQAIDENPSFPALHFELARALLVLGKPAEAAALYEAEPSQNWRRLGLPIAYHLTQREALAQEALAQLDDPTCGCEFQVAEAYAVFGKPDKAFEWLQRARNGHDAGLIYLRRDPLLASLQKDPRFRALLHEVNLPET